MEAKQNKASVSENGLLVVVRASGERTLPLLCKLIREQLTPVDRLVVLSDAESFEKKLAKAFQISINEGLPYAVHVDADILLRKKALHYIRKGISCLNSNDLGFGLLVFDRFFKRPKFRGLHVYNVQWLEQALHFIPEEGTSSRPETAVKQQMKELGHTWQTGAIWPNLTVGLHDYFQYSSDIYHKMMLRSYRLNGRIDEILQKVEGEEELSVVAQAFVDAKSEQTIHTNKFLYNFEGNETQKLEDLPEKIEHRLKKELLKHFGYSRWFLASFYPQLGWLVKQRK